MKLIETKIPAGDLEIGMYVTRLDRPWLETGFLIQGFMIQSKKEIDALCKECEFVFIEGTLNISRANKRSGGKASGKTKSKAKKDPRFRYELPEKKATYINKVSVDKEFDEAKITFKDARNLAHSIMDGLRIGRTLDINQARAIVSDCVESVLRNPDALLWLTQIKKRDDYTAEHCMNVCVLTATFARHLGLLESEIETVALCGLLHDVGKAKVPLEVLNKPGRLDDEELKIMNMHTVYGRDMLMSAGHKVPICIDVAYSHHERIDGSGYPRQLDHSRMPLFAKIVAITDTYDAITSNRCYENGRSSMQALKIISQCSGTQFDAELATEFIKCIGVFPPGTIVEMKTGEVGIVIATDEESRLRPKVILLLDENKKKRNNEKVVDLRKLDLDAEGLPYVIARELSNGSHGIELADYLDKGLMLQDGDQAKVDG